MTKKSPSTALAVKYQPISALRRNERNARIHSEAQIRQIQASMAEFGICNPILVDKKNNVIAGHGRLAASERLGIHSVPTIQLEHLSQSQLRAYVIADNRLAELAGWDRDLLALELGELAALELDFDLTITGFELPEIDLMIHEQSQSSDPLDDIPDAEPGAPIVTQAGDLRIVGERLNFLGRRCQRSV